MESETELAAVNERNAERMRERHARLKAQHEATVKGTQSPGAGETTELANLSRPAPWNWEDMDFDDEQSGGLSLKEWAELDLGALAIMGAKKFVQQRPVLVSTWVFGLLVASLAGGFPVSESAQEAYTVMKNHSDAIGSVEITRALHELRVSESNYYATKGFWSCDENCTRSYDRLQMAQAELARASRHREEALAEARSEVGIWSSFGVQDVRDRLWSSWKSGKDFAERLTWWDAVFLTVGRDEPIQQVILRMVLKYTLNLTLGLISCFCYFVYSVYGLIVSYGSSFLSGAAFFLLALVAGLSVVSAYLGSMYAVVGGGYMMYMKQSAIKQAIEGSSQKKLERLEGGKRVPGPGLRCPV
eukprot:TRINITY_DN28439_c0_g1_i1.p1 TRINITY_DN28439_c0_g1~~TRINITY_DN28439_c0_g1_i1.p1  ORF type:complete len:359 (-),score=61.19 TRINITY_DN28439_c0_g1_i1:74-1150(-)